LELAEYLAAKNWADEGLQIQPDSVKRLFRRGLWNLGLKEPRLAKKDFEKVLELEPTNKLTSQKLHVSNEIIKEDSEKERKLYAKMFGAQD
jgi:tetratricopeptide (TPR) repeat protein